jgi:hypothetical protein
MPAYFVHGGARLDVDDIPLEVYVKIHAETGLEWWEVAPAPMRSTKAASILFREACVIAGVAPPAELTPKTLFAGFVIEAGENRATEFDDGIPAPKAEVEPATT